MMMTKVLITGATGLLGRPLMDEFSAARGFETTGLGWSRAGHNLIKLDLRDAEATAALIRDGRPDVIIHSAAERRPDVSEKDPEGTKELNVEATRRLAELADEIGAWIIYLSTDYVFDGTAPPYAVDAQPNPLNAYGQSKLDGEVAVRESHANGGILRVPILYGPVEDLAESAITVVAAKLLETDGGRVKLDHWATRYPTHTADVAVVCRQLVEAHQRQPDLGGAFHWSGDEPMTKYDMGLAMAPILGVSADLIEPDATPSPGAPRPKDCHLDCSRLAELGIGQGTPFARAIREILEPHLAPR
jgi:dTDP-4-dehydrorhamnose reductase